MCGQHHQTRQSKNHSHIHAKLQLSSEPGLKTAAHRMHMTAQACTAKCMAGCSPMSTCQLTDYWTWCYAHSGLKVWAISGACRLGAVKALLQFVVHVSKEGTTQCKCTHKRQYNTQCDGQGVVRLGHSVT